MFYFFQVGVGADGFYGISVVRLGPPRVRCRLGLVLCMIMCPILEINDVLSPLSQILLKDIEAHGPVLKSVLRQYERIAAAAAAPPPPQPAAADSDPSTATKDLPSTSSSTSTSASTSRATSGRRSGKDIPRKARSLEKRWHQIYLRSLEWHYYLEGVIANFKVGARTCVCVSE